MLQKHLEDTVQSALNKILGEGKSIVYISLIAEETKWEINYTKIPEIEGVENMGGTKKQSTIVPGIPSLRFLTEGAGGENSLPLNYEVIEKSPIIKNKEVIIILDSKIKLGELRSLKLFVTKFLNLDEEKGDKLTILKENFSELERKEALSKQKLTTRSKFSLLNAVILAVAALAGIIFLVIIWRLLFKGKKKEPIGTEEPTQYIAAKGAGEVKPESTDEQKKMLEDEKKKKEEEEKIEIMNKNILGNGIRYFNFINEENIYKLKFLLQVKIALQQASPRTIAVVMACLPFKLAASILIEYPIKIQSEICNNLINLQHYPEKDMAVLEEEIKSNIDYLFGGKYRLQQIMEKISGEDKKKILRIIQKQYPAVADELNSLIVLFEDILELDEDSLATIFKDIDTEVIATSLVHIDSTLQRKITDRLPKGVQAMVDQWLNLKTNTASRYDVEQARQKVITMSQNLEKEGFIRISHE
ncbi:MAG: FliG C-terminal domain-containing protein [Candidatus Margulisbacteria bacterium]|nr:FliG C-terminal domain-containing protein [Candidatus Margulisiibacteriota bacterium]